MPQRHLTAKQFIAYLFWMTVDILIKKTSKNGFGEQLLNRLMKEKIRKCLAHKIHFRCCKNIEIKFSDTFLSTLFLYFQFAKSRTNFYQQEG